MASKAHHHHGQDCNHHHVSDAHSSFRLAFFLNAFFALIELIGGIWCGSFAVTVDALHDFGDALSIGVAWAFEKLALKEADQRYHFGYKRFSLLAASLTGIVILASATAIAIQGVIRLYSQLAGNTLPSSEQSLNSDGMIGFAVIGILVNAAAAWSLRKGKTHSQKILNWHMIEDLLGWSLVLVGGVIIKFTNWLWIDSLLAIALSVFVGIHVFKHLQDAILLLMQMAPRDFNLNLYIKRLQSIEGIATVSQCRIWSLDGATCVGSMKLHLHKLENSQLSIPEIEKIKTEVRRLSDSEFDLRELTLETCLIHHSDCSDSKASPS